MRLLHPDDAVFLTWQPARAALSQQGPHLLDVARRLRVDAMMARLA
jgi:hypothetical protein